MALGASRRSITLAVLKRAAILVGLGLAIGAAGAIAGNRVLNSLLHGLSFNTIQLLLVAGALVVVTAGLAAFLPAVRAASVDPLKSLRAD
jgi:ABC-type antimicrobial peptide transport system permease subunit